MRRRTLLALTGTTVLAGTTAAVTGGALAGTTAASGPAVTVRIEGLKKTLLLPTRLRTHSGWITRYGAPSGKCSARSAQGALDTATHGHWRGKWYSTYNEYFIKSILRETPAGSDYWDIFLNNKPASVGACDLELHRGDRLLFADASGKDGASALTAPSSAIAGRAFRVKLLGYSANGQSKPLAGVRITGNGITAVRTNRSGVAHVVDQKTGVLVLRAAPKGDIRTEAVVHLAHR